MRDINSKSQITKKSLEWDFNDPHEEDGKETDLKWYLCTFCYVNKPDNMKEGITGMIMYNKRNNSSLRNHVVTAHKMFFHTLFLTWMGAHIFWMLVMPPPLREVWIPIYSFVKYQMMSPLSLV